MSTSTRLPDPSGQTPTHAPLQIRPVPATEPILVSTAHNASHEAVMRLAWAVAVRMKAGVQIVNAPGCVAAAHGGSCAEADLRADQVLVNAARETHARLVIVGRGERDAAERARSERTILRLLRHLPVPVYAVDPEAVDLPRRIVVGMDFSECATHAAQAALSLAAADAVVTLVHVATVSGDLMEWERTYEHALPALFDMVRPRLELQPGMRLETQVVDAPVPGVALAAYAASVGADLVVAGANGQGMLKSPAIGSCATEVLRGTPCSYLCAPPTAAGVAHPAEPSVALPS